MAYWFRIANTIDQGNSADQGYSISEDATGIYACGSCYGASNNDIVIYKFNQDGQDIWRRRITGIQQDYAYGICAKKAGTPAGGGAWLVGETYNGTTADCLHVNLNQDGGFIWADRQAGPTSGADIYYAAATSPVADELYLVGSHWTGNEDIVVMKVLPTVRYDWILKLAGAGADTARAVTVDFEGNVYVVGNTSVANTDALIVKIRPDSTVLWQKRLYGTSTDRAWGVACDPSGNVYVTGETSNGTNADIFIAKYSSAGALLWQRRYYGTAIDIGRAVAADATGVYVTGHVQIGGKYYAIIIKYDSDGVWQWHRTIYSGSDTYGYGIKLAQDGSLLWCGSATIGASLAAVFAKLPSTGAGTGTYGNIVYGDAASGVTQEAAGTMTSSDSSLTASAASLTSTSSTTPSDMNLSLFNNIDRWEIT